MWGVAKQGLICDGCHHPLHYKCLKSAMSTTSCGDPKGLKIAAGKMERTLSKSSSNNKNNNNNNDNSNNNNESNDKEGKKKRGSSFLKKEGDVKFGVPDSAHPFELVTFTKPTYCALCKQFIYGLVKQGLRCALCGIAVHKKCEAECSKKLQCTAEDQMKLGKNTLDDWRTEKTSDVSEGSKEIDHLIVDDELVSAMRKEGYDADEIIVAMYKLYDKQEDYTDKQLVVAEIQSKWQNQLENSIDKGKAFLCYVVLSHLKDL